MAVGNPFGLGGTVRPASYPRVTAPLSLSWATTIFAVCVVRHIFSGSRPRQPVDQRYENGYLFGAICPARGTGAALACGKSTPKPCSFIYRDIAPRRRGLRRPFFSWTAPDGMRRGASTCPETSRRSSCHLAQLNPVENIWQYIRANWLSNRVFETYGATKLGEARRSTQDNHLNRDAKLGAVGQFQ